MSSLLFKFLSPQKRKKISTKGDDLYNSSSKTLLPNYVTLTVLTSITSSLVGCCNYCPKASPKFKPKP
jgi:hypothetical protein